MPFLIFFYKRNQINTTTTTTNNSDTNYQRTTTTKTITTTITFKKKTKTSLLFCLLLLTLVSLSVVLFSFYIYYYYNYNLCRGKSSPGSFQPSPGFFADDDWNDYFSLLEKVYFLLMFTSAIIFLLYWIKHHKSRHYYLLVSMGSNPTCRRKQVHMNEVLCRIAIVAVAHVPITLLTSFGLVYKCTRGPFVTSVTAVLIVFCFMIGFSYLLVLLFDTSFDRNLYNKFRSCRAILNVNALGSRGKKMSSNEESYAVGSSSDKNCTTKMLIMLCVAIVSILNIILFKQESYKEGIHFYYREVRNEEVHTGMKERCTNPDILHRLNDETAPWFIPLLYVGFVLWTKVFRIKFKRSTTLIGPAMVAVLLLENIVAFLSDATEPKSIYNEYGKLSLDDRDGILVSKSFTLLNFDFIFIVLCWKTLRQRLHVRNSVAGVVIVAIALLFYINQIMFINIKLQAKLLCKPNRARPYQRAMNFVVIGSSTLLLSFMTFSTIVRRIKLFWYALRYQLIRPSKDKLLDICSQNGCAALQYLSANVDCENDTSESDTLYKDRGITIAACRQNGLALKYCHPMFRSDKEIVMISCQEYGQLLELVDPKLRMDKEVVLTAVASNPDSLKYALDGLNQDQDCLVAANIWDKNRYRRDYQDHPDTTSIQNEKKIVMSTKFALSEDSQSLATKFTVLLKQHPYIRDNNFSIYSPNAFGKSTCDPEWTRRSWPCRGTYETCRKESSLKTGIPSLESCWRYSFRYQLEQARESNGFMIQLVEMYNENHLSNNDSDEQIPSSEDNKNDNLDDEDDIELAPLNRNQAQNNNGIDTTNDSDDTVDIEVIAEEEYAFGKGQSIETEMGKDVGVKSFVVYQPTDFWLPDQIDLSHVDKVAMAIKACYENQGSNENEDDDGTAVGNRTEHGFKSSTGLYDPRQDFFILPTE